MSSSFISCFRALHAHAVVPCLASVLFACIGSLALAQELPDPGSLVEAVNSDPALPEEKKAFLLSSLQDIARAAEAAENFRRQQRALESQVAQSDQQLAAYETKIRDMQRAPATVQSRLGGDPALAALESEIALIESQRAGWTRERARALDATANLASLEQERRDRLTAITAELESFAGAAAEETAKGLEQQILNLATQARRSLLEEEEKLIQLQQRAEPTLNAIRTAKVAWLDAAISEADALLSALQAATAERRQSAAAQRRAATRRLLDRLNPVRAELSAAAEVNIAMSNQFELLARRIDAAQSDIAATRQLTEGIEQDANLTRRRLGVAGLESELGDIMLTRLASLPDVRSLGAGSRQRNASIADLSIESIDAEQALRELGDPARQLRQDIPGFDAWSALEQRVALQLFEQRRDLLRENLQAKNTLLRLLVDSNQAVEELVSAAQEYRTFLTANLLWVRNYGFLAPEKLRRQLALATADDLPQTLRGASAALLQDPPLMICIAVLVLLLVRRKRIKQGLVGTLGRPIRPRDESAGLIGRTAFLTVLMAAPAPLLLFILSRGFSLIGGDDPALAGYSVTLRVAALSWAVLDFLGRAGGRFGFGRRLLKWNGQKLDTSMRDLSWFKVLFTLAAACVALGGSVSPTDSGGAIAAVGSMIIALALFLVSLRMLRSGLFDLDGFLRNSMRLCVLVASAIVVMHLSGQLFAAHLYLGALVGSIAAVLGILLLVSILQRVLLIGQANLERRARDEQRARAAVAQAGEGPDERSEADGGLEAVTSLSEAYTQMLRLFRVVALATLLWVIWSPALPALDILDSVTLWTTADTTLPAGEARPVTLSVLLLAVFALALTLLVTSQLPPLINILLREWTRVSSGVRYASAMLTQYVILGVGLSVSLGMLGFEWAKVQWLVAALGVGIGFGLQEIVANFISGLIVLFERPIRVGDIINAGGHDGTVTRINARATVIQTFERKEVMIPNKELITSVVTNWSLSDTQLRILIPVGVAYGSDVGQCMGILREVAAEHPDVLEDPAPMVTFEDFGDNALVLWLRCYATAEYLRVATELRQQIYRRYNEKGIGIAFPQRDVHLDATAPIPVRVMGDNE